MKRLLLLLLACSCFTFQASAEDWPGWRGPTGQGTSSEKNLPVTWSTTENVRWKVALPDEGNSSPIVWGDKVFITQASEKTAWPPEKPEGFPAGTSYGGAAVAELRSVMCFRRSDGELLWRGDTVYKQPEATHRDNPFCSSTPVTDGERVIAAHGCAGLVCYDLDGKLLWSRDVGKVQHVWGTASSPILYGDLCIHWCGPGNDQHLVAVDKKTGEIVWQHEEQGGDSGIVGGHFVGGWGTPLVVRVGEQDQLLQNVPALKGYDPLTGRELWSTERNVGRPQGLSYMSPVFGDGIAILGGSAYRLSEIASLSRSRIWSGMGGARVGSGVIVGEHFYLLGDGGIPKCFQLQTGEELWKSQLMGRPCTTAWGSMAYADGKLYNTDQRGTTVVLAASPKYELLAANSLDEHVNASIAVSGGNLFIRTFKHLWCIGKDSAE